VALHTARADASIYFVKSGVQAVEWGRLTRVNFEVPFRQDL
jgi:hypothetical protein